MDLDAESWRQLNQLLDEALDHAPAERPAWVESLAPQFERLKPHLRDLMSRAASVETGEFLNTLPKLVAVAHTHYPDGKAGHAVEPGETVGAYRLVRELGTGGMGSVWLAERTDGLIRRPVALKLPHLVAARRAGLAERMAREREILGTLDHRNIARLLDAGVAGDGQPFLALEYVEGVPIDRYCAGEGGAPLDIGARLRLFRQVAEAVAYAHGKLILHRDLKPANILVTAGGGVKLLDFGIAKLLDEGTAAESRLTEMSGRALTPDYASPEQILGEPLTVASDVYSLGVILFELLTGSRPYSLKRDSRGALEDAIVQAEPPRVSQVAPAALRPRLRGDLDTIAAKALKKKPLERYVTVNALADDITRHLENRPVLARPDHIGYRLRKFVSRNRLAVGAAAALLLVIVAGAVIAFWQAGRGRAPEARAQQVARFISAIFENADPYRGADRSLTAVELLRQARTRLDATTLEDPGLRLELSNTLADSMLGVNATEDALSLLDHALAAVRDTTIEPVQQRRARFLRGRALEALTRSEESLRELDALIVDLRALPEPPPRELVDAMLFKSGALNNEGRHQEAYDTINGALTLIPAEDALSVRKLEALQVKSHAAGYLGKLDEAIDSARESYEMAQRLYPGDATHAVVIAARMKYATALADRDDVETAVDLMVVSREAAIKRFGPDSLVVANYNGAMTQHFLSAGRVADALASSEGALRILLPLAEPGSVSFAALMDGRGYALVSARRASEALTHTSQALDIFRARLGEEHAAVFVQGMFRGRELALLGRSDEALRQLQRVVENVERINAAKISRPLYHQGFAMRLAGRPQEAVTLQQRALDTLPPGANARRASARILAELGLAQWAAGDKPAARRTLTEALAIFGEKFRQVSPEQADALIGMGQVELDAGFADKALAHFEGANAFWARLEPESRWAGEAAYWLWRANRRLGREAQAAEQAARARRLLGQSALPADRALARTL